MFLRRRSFIRQRNQIAAFRERLARIPGLSGLGDGSLNSRSSGSESERNSSIVGDRITETGSMTRTTMSEIRWRTYPFSGDSSTGHSSRAFF
jgi:hypothetical protein